MSKFQKEYRISLRDMSLNFRTKTTTILHNFEECFAQMCKKYDITGFDLDKMGLMWVVANINMEITDELPIWNENLKIEIWFSEIKKLRAYLEFKAYYNNTLVAKGDSLWFVLDKNTRRPVAIDKIIENCEKDEETIFETHKRNDFNKETLQKICENIYTVNFNDLDYNNHVNNVSYVDWAIMTMPDEYIKRNKIKKYSVTFNQECFLNEKIKTMLYQNNSEFCFEVLKENENIACKIDIETEKI